MIRQLLYLSLQLAEALVRPRRRSSLARILAATLVRGEWVLLDRIQYNFESILNKFTKYTLFTSIFYKTKKFALNPIPVWP